MKMTIIPHDTIKSTNFRKNSDWCNDHGISNICCICGKEVKEKESGQAMLHWFDGGDLLTDFEAFPEELRKKDQRFSESGDLNFYPVGPSCYKKWLEMKNSGKFEQEI